MDDRHVNLYSTSGRLHGTGGRPCRRDNVILGGRGGDGCAPGSHVRRTDANPFSPADVYSNTRSTNGNGDAAPHADGDATGKNALASTTGDLDLA